MRPIMSSICDELINALELGDKEPISILYLDESGVARQHQSAINETYDGDIKTGSGPQLEVLVDEEFITEDQPTQGVGHVEYPPIFRDDRLNVLLRPVYRTCYLNIEFKKRFTDKTRAMKWRDTMMYKGFEYGDLIHHHLTYHYLIPKEVLYVLEEIHRRREAIAGYGESFLKWLKDGFSVRLTRLANLSGEQSQLGVSERQNRCYGQFDFDVAPEKGDKGENQTWTIGFNYRLHYSRITHLVLTYPQVIHQQPLEWPCVWVDEGNLPRDEERSFPLSGMLLEGFSHRPQAKGNRSFHGECVPKDDEWVPPSVPDYTWRMLSVQPLLEEEDGGVVGLGLLDLNDLPEYRLDEEILAFMKESEAKYMHLPRFSVFNVSLYNQWSLLNADSLRVTESGLVTNRLGLNLRHDYRIRLGLYHDWSVLHRDAIDRLKRWPGVINKLIDHLNIDHVHRDCWMRNDHLNELIARTTHWRITPERRMYTVEDLHATAYRRDDGIQTFDLDLINRKFQLLCPKS